ncbi:ribosomal protein S5 domain 2-type protein [Phakopsora pachyrhizi]|nr:ribosomal protein S5 domain 2-type protein [Phakopsora pachyrhizi]
MENHTGEQSNCYSIKELVSILEANNRSALSAELSILEAIFGAESISGSCDLSTAEGLSEQSNLITLNVELQLSTGSESAQEDPLFKIRTLIPDGYPTQALSLKFELLSCYLGPFRVDEELIEAVKKTGERVFVEGCGIYDGIEQIKDLLTTHYIKKVDLRKNFFHESKDGFDKSNASSSNENYDQTLDNELLGLSIDLKEDTLYEFFTSSTIVDRKSVFIGYSVRLTDPKEVPKIMSQLLSDKKIAKATHKMTAWRCEFNGFLHQDNDDDGETAAGSRMQHLLNILQVKNVFVCVSRWFGGVHLGSDRFKVSLVFKKEKINKS